MDADLQDDPVEIPRFLAKLDEGYDIVSGWKRSRHDPWHKVLPSRVFNKMLSSLNGVKLHDHNCGFKCYRSEVVKNVTLYGEMHRMIPSLGSIKGFRSSEIEVQHHPRLHGRSKYGVKRFLRGFMDMLTVYFLKHFRERPLHLFGGTGISALIMGAAVMGSSFIPGEGPQLIAWMRAIAEVLAGAAAPLMAFGFIGELMVHGRIEKERRPIISEAVRVTVGSAVHAAVGDKIVPLVPADFGGKTPLILVADDEKSIRDLMRHNLEKAGMRVKEAVDGNEALAMASREIDAIVLDLNMPNKGGIECLAHLRNQLGDVPVIVVSGGRDVTTAVRAMKMGAFDYITKPYTTQQFVDIVRRALKARSLAVEMNQGVA